MTLFDPPLPDLQHDALAAPQGSKPAPDALVAGDYWHYCPNCSARLENRGCKFRCPRCHYFMSCSDFD